MDIEVLTDAMPIPKWARGTRFENLYICDMWLDGEQYSHIKYAFAQEQDGGQFRKMWERRPSVRLNLPILGAKLTSRKLFAGKHAPRLVHKDEKIQDALKWLARTAKIDWHMLGAVRMGQSGSVALTFAIVDEIPVINVWAGKHCVPKFDDADQLTELVLCYTVPGYEWMASNEGTRTDCDGKPIDVNGDYWYIRTYNDADIVTWQAIPAGDWEPVTGFIDSTKRDKIKELDKVPHNAGFVPAMWLRNMPNGNNVDGESSFGRNALSNCIHIDYTLSQLGRGINYMAAPQLMVKGRVMNYEKTYGNTHVFGPAHMLNLPMDRSDPGGAGVSGADAKMIEMTGDGIKVGMENWVERIKVWTLELMSISRKDPNNIKGAMSGKAIELLDEDFIDFVQILRTSYGEYGSLEVAKRLSEMLIAAGHEKFKGISEKAIDEIEQEWPRLYSPDPEEIKQLVEGISGAITAGLVDPEPGVKWFQTQVDVRSPDATGMPAENPPPTEPQTPQTNANNQAQTKVTVTVPGSASVGGSGTKKPNAKAKPNRGT